VLSPEVRMSVNDAIPVEIRAYENGSVVFVNPELPTWVRSSSTGLWLFQYLKEIPSTISEALTAVANHYSLPAHVVSESTIRFLNEMVRNEFLVAEHAYDNACPSISSQVATLTELGLQELWLDVTALCHGACQHCYKPQTGPHHFPLSELEDLLLQAKTLGTANLIITGGEPLLHPEFSRLMTLARAVSDWTIKVITGGRTPSSEIVDPILGNADIVQVSLDGLDKDTNDPIRGEGAFERAVALLKALTECEYGHRARVGIGFTPFPQNISQIEEMHKWAYAQGMDFVHFNHLKPGTKFFTDLRKREEQISKEFFKKCVQSIDKLTVRIEKDLQGNVLRRGGRPVSVDRSFAPYESLFSLLKKHNCGAGITILSITENGDVYPCAPLQAFPETRIGNWLEKRDLSELYAWARRWNESVFSVDAHQQCKSCHLRYFCGGGCRARSGSLAGTDIMCEAIKTSYDEFFASGELLIKKRGK